MTPAPASETRYYATFLPERYFSVDSGGAVRCHSNKYPEGDAPGVVVTAETLENLCAEGLYEDRRLTPAEVAAIRAAWKEGQ